MIVPRPCIVLNSSDVPGKKYVMDKYIKIDVNDSAKSVINKIIANITDVKHGLIFNCHGSSARISMGAGFGFNNISDFELLKNKLLYFGIVACQVSKGEIGKMFCKKLAIILNTVVIASDYYQMGELILFNDYMNEGEIDFPEGNINAFYPNGEIKTITFSDALFQDLFY